MRTTSTVIHSSGRPSLKSMKKQVFHGRCTRIKNNFDDNPLAWFEQYQDAPASSALASKGMAFLGLDEFYKNAAAGTLPESSFIIGPAELSEHQPFMPKDGAWLQKKVIDSVVSSPKYNSSCYLLPTTV